MLTLDHYSQGHPEKSLYSCSWCLDGPAALSLTFLKPVTPFPLCFSIASQFSFLNSPFYLSVPVCFCGLKLSKESYRIKSGVPHLTQKRWDVRLHAQLAGSPFPWEHLWQLLKQLKLWETQIEPHGPQHMLCLGHISKNSKEIRACMESACFRGQWIKYKVIPSNFYLQIPILVHPQCTAPSQAWCPGLPGVSPTH